MFKILDLDHVVLRVSNLDRMMQFYVEVLGCLIDKVQEDIGLYQLRAGSALIDLVPVDSVLGRQGGAAPEVEGRNLDHFCLRIEPFDGPAIIEYFKTQGLEIGPVETRYGSEGDGPSLYLQDPEGNMIELKGPPT